MGLQKGYGANQAPGFVLGTEAEFSGRRGEISLSIGNA
jgi:hypothetical protein